MKKDFYKIAFFFVFAFTLFIFDVLISAFALQLIFYVPSLLGQTLSVLVISFILQKLMKRYYREGDRNFQNVLVATAAATLYLALSAFFAAEFKILIGLIFVYFIAISYFFVYRKVFLISESSQTSVVTSNEGFSTFWKIRKVLVVIALVVWLVFSILSFPF